MSNLLEPMNSSSVIGPPVALVLLFATASIEPKRLRELISHNLGGSARDTAGVGTDTAGVGTETDGVGTDAVGAGTDADGVGTDDVGVGTGAKGFQKRIQEG